MNNPKPPNLKLIWGAAIFLVFIGVVIVFRRTIFLVPVLQGTYEPSENNALLPFPVDGFVNNPRLTLMHLLPALLFAVLGLTQFIKAIRAKRINVHRWNGRIVVISGLVVGVSGIVMGFKMGISGISEVAATSFFGVLFLFSLIKGYVHIRRREYALHREWMIRAFAIGMAVTATRPIVGIFFATSSLTGLGPRDFFGTALWIGFTVQLIAAEVWINRTRALS